MILLLIFRKHLNHVWDLDDRIQDCKMLIGEQVHKYYHRMMALFAENLPPIQVQEGIRSCTAAKFSFALL